MVTRKDQPACTPSIMFWMAWALKFVVRYGFDDMRALSRVTPF